MKKLFILLLFVSFGQIVVAQKFGYIDTDYILAQMPEYKEAQAEHRQDNEQAHHAQGVHQRQRKSGSLFGF